MRVLLINQFYLPDFAATAQVMAGLAEGLVQRGHHVDVLSSTSIYDGRSLDLPRHEVINGVHVHRVGSGARRGDRLRDRARSYLGFHLAAHARAARLPRPDIVVPLTTPPMICLIGTWMRRFRQSINVPWVMDVYPEIAVRHGVLRDGGPTHRFWRVLNGISMRSANRIVTLSPGMQAVLARRGVDPARISVLAPWSDDLPSPPEGTPNPFREAHVPHGRLAVMYSGNLGVCHLWREFAQAVELLQENKSLHFLFIGGGKGMPPLKKAVGHLPNVTFLPYQDRVDLPKSLAAGDIHLSSLDPRFEGLLLPSKIFGVMAIGRPLVHVGDADSDVASIITRHDCGRVSPPEDPAALAAILADMADHPTERQRLGHNGRRASETFYGKKTLVDQFVNILEAEAAQPRRTGR